MVQAREQSAQGRIVRNGWSVIPGGFPAEVMASLGWDALTTAGIHTASSAFAGRMAEIGFRSQPGLMPQPPTSPTRRR
jgi:hypothetical protein